MMRIAYATISYLWIFRSDPLKTKSAIFVEYMFAIEIGMDGEFKALCGTANVRTRNAHTLIGISVCQSDSIRNRKCINSNFISFADHDQMKVQHRDERKSLKIIKKIYIRIKI